MRSKPRGKQIDLFSPDEEEVVIPLRIGHSSISVSESRSILTKTTGFMSGYDFSLNPYSGCSCGCTYCSAIFFVRDSQEQADWGSRSWIARCSPISSGLYGSQ